MDKDVKKAQKEPRRKRRTAESARRAILDAASRRLMEEGPDGLRLKVIAKDVGISHSSILHHFGNRDGLLQALRNDAFDALARDLRARMDEPSEGDPSVDFFEKVSQTLGEGGYGRLLAWQLMAGNLPVRASVGKAVLGPNGSGGLLDGLARALHAMRVQRATALGQPEPDLDETRRICVMAGCALLGEAIAGDVMIRSAGLGGTPSDRRAFRAWFAKQAEGIVFPRRSETPQRPTEDTDGAAEDGRGPAEEDHSE